MGGAQDAIKEGKFPEYLKKFFKGYYAGARVTSDSEPHIENAAATEPLGPTYPRWCVDALRSVNVDILEGVPNARVVDDDGARWEYA